MAFFLRFFTRNTTKIPVKIPAKQAIPAGTGIKSSNPGRDSGFPGIPVGLWWAPEERQGGAPLAPWVLGAL